MSLRVIRAGLQTTIQGAVRHGYRHFGMPWSGPADPLSMSLANRLVGNDVAVSAIEITLMGAAFEFSEAVSIGLAGAPCQAKLGGAPIELHKSVTAKEGDVLEISPVSAGCRVYLAIAGGVRAADFLGSTSTYLPGGLGGFEGRALKDGDEIEFSAARTVDNVETPLKLRPYFNDTFMLQVADGPDFDWLDVLSRNEIFSRECKATQRTSRMGCELSADVALSLRNSQSKSSSAVFPGSVQCPPEGKPYVLLADAQTTGGYPHILQVIRSDRFQLGQIRPGARIRFLRRSPDDAMARLRSRWEAYSDWLSEPVL